MRGFFNILLVAFGSFTALLGLELLFRLCGESPGPAPVPLNPALFAFRAPFMSDSIAGWQLRPGKYQLVLGGRSSPSQISINSDGSRATRTAERTISSPRKILFIGDSYTFGEGLDDNETLPWRLQELLPERNVINHGVGGYGTCQALLRLETLKSFVEPGDIVVYGLSWFHEERNTADPRLDYWAAMSSPLHQSGYPKCKAAGDEIGRQPSRVWDIMLPLTGQSVLSKILTNAWLSALAIDDRKEQRNLTDALIRKMKKTVDERDATFIVLLQEMFPEALSHYQHLMNEFHIDYVDGTARSGTGELSLPDGHPGPEMTRVWARQLRDHILHKGLAATLHNG